MSEYFAGRKPEELALTTREHYKSIGVDAYFGDAVATIETAKPKQSPPRVAEALRYDKLVLATGSYPFVPPIPGADLPDCLVYRTIDDLGMIQARSKKAKVGSGGPAVACWAWRRPMPFRISAWKTHVVEFAPGLMGVQLDNGGSAMLRRKIEALDVQVHTSKATQTIEETDGKDTRLVMNFADGETLATDVIVFSAGIRPSDQLARDCGLEVGPRGGITIDYHCRTSDSDIFAIGECALYGGMIFGLVAPTATAWRRWLSAS